MMRFAVLLMVLGGAALAGCDQALEQLAADAGGHSDVSVSVDNHARCACVLDTTTVGNCCVQ
jgi:hypothetical protein